MVQQEDIRVLLADDHTMVRQGLSQILEDSEGISVVGQAEDGRQALELVASARPQLVVLDYSMPNMDGPATVERLRQDFPDVRILMLTIHDNIHYAVRVLELGAHGYVVKSAAAHELVEAIRTVHNGEIYISPEVSHKVIQHMWDRKKNRSGLTSLSQREFELLRVFGAGMSLKGLCRGPEYQHQYRVNLPQPHHGKASPQEYGRDYPFRAGEQHHRLKTFPINGLGHSFIAVEGQYYLGGPK